MIIGYLRVSTAKQHLENQQEEIKKFAEARGRSVDRWVTEVVSGNTKEVERKLGGLLRRMKSGDTLIVTEISRLSRTLTDIMGIMGKCLKKDIRLYSTSYFNENQGGFGPEKGRGDGAGPSQRELQQIQLADGE